MSRTLRTIPGRRIPTHAIRVLVEGGRVAHIENIPPGAAIAVIDYDTEGGDLDLCDHDDEGAPCVVEVWEPQEPDPSADPQPVAYFTVINGDTGEVIGHIPAARGGKGFKVPRRRARILAGKIHRHGIVTPGSLAHRHQGQHIAVWIYDRALPPGTDASNENGAWDACIRDGKWEKED